MRVLEKTAKRATEGGLYKALCSLWEQEPKGNPQAWVDANVPVQEQSTPHFVRAFTMAVARFVFEREPPAPDVENSKDNEAFRWCTGALLKCIRAPSDELSAELQMHCICSLHALAERLQWPAST